MNGRLTNPSQKSIAIAFALGSLIAFACLRSPLQAIRYNWLTLEWIGAFPTWTGTMDWPLELQQADRSSLERVNRQLVEICVNPNNGAISNRLGACRLSGRFRAIPSFEKPDVIFQQDVADVRGTSRMLTAAFAGDVAFSLGDMEKAATIWTENLSNEDLLWRAGRIAKAGQFELAEGFLADLHHWKGNLSGAQTLELARLLARLGTHYSAIGHPETAAHYWQLAIDTDPKPNYYHGLGASLARQERWLEAEAALKTATVLEPDDPGHLLALASVYRGMGRETLAITTASAALELDPGNRRAQRFLNRE